MRALDIWSNERPDAIAYTFLPDGEETSTSLSFGELHRRALAVCGRLTALGAYGQRALLVYPQGLEFIVAFFGCLYAGVIAVPASLPNRKHSREALSRVATDAGAKWLLSTGDLLERLAAELGAPADAPRLACVDTESCEPEMGPVERAAVVPSELALLQYTSGSTGLPRGVAVTHANLVDNQRQLTSSVGHDASSPIVSWLPMFHDMGLGTVLHGAWLGARVVLMSPRGFLRNPRRWLWTISEYRATTSGGPDFAYDLCARRIAAADRAGLDLSCWRVAYNGSEPVRAATLDRFSEAFSASGFRRESFRPLYGLAEATLFVSADAGDRPPLVRRFEPAALERGVAERAPDTMAARTLVGCGHAWSGTRIAIVRPETREPCVSGEIGEIWIQGASVAAGYWGRQAETEQTFRARTEGGDGPFLRTGDLGFLQDGQLFVTGRHKDLIIVRGRNHYPQDVEDSVSSCHPALVAGACAAFSVETEQGEELVVVQEVARSALRTLDAAAVVRTIRGAISEHHALHTHAIVLIMPTGLPRTTSGKVRRKACRAGYLEKSLPAVAAWASPLTPAPSPDVTMDDARRARSTQADALIEWLRRHAADLIHSFSLDERLKSPIPLLRALGKQGVLGMQIGPEYGGMGLGHAELVRVLEQLGAVDFALALFVGVNNALAVQPIARFGGPRLRALLLPGLTHAQELAASAFDEPVTRATPAGLMVRAESDGDDHWRLFGSQYLDGLAQEASIITVFAHHDEPPGVSAFVLSEGMAGLRQVGEGLATGLLGFARGTVVMEGVSVGRENLLGSLASGPDIARSAMLQARLAIAAACIGGMKRCAQAVGGFDTHGRLTPNPVTLSRLGSITASISALECLVNRIALALDAGYGVPDEAFAACKILGPELLLRCIDDSMGLSLNGGFGESTRLSRLHRDANLLRNFGGLPEAVAEVTGAGVMESDASLRRLLEEVLHAPEVTRSIEPALLAVRQRMSNLEGALARRAQRWAQTRAGELTAWLVLLAAVDGSRNAERSAELERSYAWARAQFQQALSAIRWGTPSETATLDTSDVLATFAAYADTIGELRLTPHPARRGSDRARTQAPVGSAAPTPAASSEERAQKATSRKLQDWIVSWLARHLQLSASQIEPSRSFADHGLDSVAAVELAKALSDEFGRELDETLLFSFPTIDALVSYLTAESRSVAATAALGSRAQPSTSVALPPAAPASTDSPLDEELARLEEELRSRS
jgi:acyl-CoA synthetase (AMP-forming)/AMP-acid ligase II/alkylation response protein AidB-like acyl-CoA dehydrogenase/acyl carrier protein